jgi:hypothetical protein
MKGAQEKSGTICTFKGNFIVGLILAIITFGLGQPGIALAEEDGYGPGQDRWKFELGGFFPSINTNLKIDGENVGDRIDLEDLGFSDNDSLFRLDGYWRFAQKHRLGFNFYQFNRDGSTVLDTSIEIGDEVFPINARTASELNLDFYTLDYLYSFYQGEKWELAGGLGVYWVALDFSINASLDINNNPIPGGPFYESTDVSGPLPFLLLSFEYYITPKWLAIFRGGYFQLKVEDIDGTLTTLGAKLEYQFTKRWGLGLGYDSFRIDVDVVDNNLKSNVEYKYHGIQVYGILRF